MEQISQSSIYWITRCSSISNTLITLSIVFGIISFIFLLMILCTFDDNTWYRGAERKETIKLRSKTYYIFRITCPMFFIFVLGNTFVPTTQEMIAITVIPRIANNENIQGLGDDFITTARDWLKELAPKKEEHLKK